MDEKQKYLERTRCQIDRLIGSVREFEQAVDADKKDPEEWRHTKADLERKQTAVLRRLDELEQSSWESWAAMKDGLEMAILILADSLSRSASRLN